MSHRTIMGELGLHSWKDKPEYREANNGLGMCNTGSGSPYICALGGIGCDVDHAWIAWQRYEAEKESESGIDEMEKAA